MHQRQRRSRPVDVRLVGHPDDVIRLYQTMERLLCLTDPQPLRARRNEPDRCAGYLVVQPDEPTATATNIDGKRFDRAQYAAHLAHQLDTNSPAEGDRVRLTYPTGTAVEGEWVATGDGPALVLDGGGLHHPRADLESTTVIKAVDRPRLPLMNEREYLAVAYLLDELAGVYGHEDPLGRLARQMSVRLFDRLGI